MLLTAINHDRAAHHAPALILDAAESRCSLRHSHHMAAQGAISHDQFPSDVCIPHQIAGENVGAAYGSGVDAVLTLDRMMMAEGPCPRAPCTPAEFQAHGHYLNLINPAYKRVGIGIFSSGGDVWLTEDFVG